MTLSQRMPYVTALAAAGTLLLLAAWGEWMDGNLIIMGVDILGGLLALGTAALLGLGAARGWMPEWAHRFELVTVNSQASRSGRVPAVLSLHCNRCDSTVLPPGAKITLPRLLSYAHTHVTLACEPHRAADPEDTRRIGPDQQRRGTTRP